MVRVAMCAAPLSFLAPRRGRCDGHLREIKETSLLLVKQLRLIKVSPNDDPQPRVLRGCKDLLRPLVIRQIPRSLGHRRRHFRRPARRPRKELPRIVPIAPRDVDRPVHLHHPLRALHVNTIRSRPFRLPAGIRAQPVGGSVQLVLHRADGRRVATTLVLTH